VRSLRVSDGAAIERRREVHDARRKVSGGGRNRAAVVSLTCRSKFPRQAARAAETRVGWRETFEVFCGARRGSIKQRTCFTFIKPRVISVRASFW
jgi:hypothetical protein